MLPANATCRLCGLAAHVNYEKPLSSMLTVVGACMCAGYWVNQNRFKLLRKNERESLPPMVGSAHFKIDIIPMILMFAGRDRQTLTLFY